MSRIVCYEVPQPDFNLQFDDEKMVANFPDYYPTQEVTTLKTQVSGLELALQQQRTYFLALLGQLSEALSITNINVGWDSENETLTVEATCAGGFTPYTTEWELNPETLVLTVTVTDAIGNTATQTVNLANAYPISIASVDVSWNNQLVVTANASGGIGTKTTTHTLNSETLLLTVTVTDSIGISAQTTVNLADIYPITISNIDVTWDNELVLDATATGGFGAYNVEFTQASNILTVTVTDQIGITKQQQVNLDDISPIQITSATYEVIDNVAHVTIVAIGGFGNLSYTCNGVTNTTGLFEIAEAGTYGISVSDEGGATSATDSIVIDIFPPLKDDVLIHIDGVESAGQLIDLSGNSNNVVVTDNLLTNPSCELDFGWNTWAGGTAPLLNERSTEQVHAGTYSRKINLSGVQGVQSLPYFTKTGDVVNYSFWIRSYAGTATIRYIIRNGIDNANIVSVSLGNPAQNTWINVTGSYTETAGGSNAKVVIYLTSGDRNFYIDDFNFTISGVKNIILPQNSTISSSLVTASKYYSGIYPLTVRTDNIVYNQDNQVFFNIDGSSYKFMLYNQQIYGRALIQVLNWLGYDFFETIVNVVTVKKDGTGDYLTIPAAIAGITDSSATKPYRIDIYDDFTITSKSSYSNGSGYYRYIVPKVGMFLNGVGTIKKLECSIESSASDDETLTYEPCSMEHYGGIRNMHISMKNGRYAMHNDSLDSGILQIYTDCIFEHKGNQEVIDYRISNSLPYSSVFGGAFAVGNGTSQGVNIIYNNCTFKAIRGYYTHNNNNFASRHYIQHNKCVFEASGVYEANINPISGKDQCHFISCLNSDQINVNEYNQCTFNAKIKYYAIINDSGLPSGISYILADTRLIGANNTGYTWDNISTEGGALFIKSNSNGSVAITGGTAESVIIPTADEFNYGRLGRLEVGEWAKNTAMKLGARLGDCSSVNKTLTLTVDGTQNITVTFNQDFTSQTNAQILTFINNALGSYATASLYQRAKDYVPEFN